MFLHHAALALNNEAIERLQMGQEDEALALFEKGWVAVSRETGRSTVQSGQTDMNNGQSLQTLPVAVLSPSSDTAPDESTEDLHYITDDPVPMDKPLPNQALSNGASTPDFSIWSVSMDDFMDDEDEPLSAPNAFAMFTRPFEFHVNTKNDAFAWTSCNVMLPVILSFNKGFAHHSMAVQEKAVAESSYRHALECYTWSHHALPNVAKRGGYHELEFNLLVMALLNNMGHCCAMLDLEPRAWSCWDKLRVAWAATRHMFLVPVEERLFYDLRVSLGRTMTEASLTDLSSVNGLLAMRL